MIFKGKFDVVSYLIREKKVLTIFDIFIDKLFKALFRLCPQYVMRPRYRARVTTW